MFANFDAWANGGRCRDKRRSATQPMAEAD